MADTSLAQPISVNDALERWKSAERNAEEAEQAAASAERAAISAERSAQAALEALEAGMRRDREQL